MSILDVTGLFRPVPSVLLMHLVTSVLLMRPVTSVLLMRMYRWLALCVNRSMFYILYDSRLKSYYADKYDGERGGRSDAVIGTACLSLAGSRGAECTHRGGGSEWEPALDGQWQIA